MRVHWLARLLVNSKWTRLRNQQGLRCSGHRQDELNPNILAARIAMEVATGQKKKDHFEDTQPQTGLADKALNCFSVKNHLHEGKAIILWRGHCSLYSFQYSTSSKSPEPLKDFYSWHSPLQGSSTLPRTLLPKLQRCDTVSVPQ